MVIHDKNQSWQRNCWNCDYWDPKVRQITFYGDTEESGRGKCTCHKSPDYGKETGNMHQCYFFNPWPWH